MSAFDKAKEIIAAIPRYHVVSQCDECHYAEEAYVDFSPDALFASEWFGLGNYSSYIDASKTPEQNLWLYYDHFYKGIGIHYGKWNGHPHPVKVQVKEASKYHHICSLRRIAYPAF